MAYEGAFKEKNEGEDDRGRERSIQADTDVERRTFELSLFLWMDAEIALGLVERDAAPHDEESAAEDDKDRDEERCRKHQGYWLG